MDKDVLDWLDRKQEYIQLLRGESSLEDQKEWIYEQMQEVVKLEHILFQKNLIIEKLMLERDGVVSKIQSLVRAMEEVVSVNGVKEEKAKEAESLMDVA